MFVLRSTLNKALAELVNARQQYVYAAKELVEAYGTISDLTKTMRAIRAEADKARYFLSRVPKVPPTAAQEMLAYMLKYEVRITRTPDCAASEAGTYAADDDYLGGDPEVLTDGHKTGEAALSEVMRLYPNGPGGLSQGGGQ